jgi:hypothetical protein
MKKLISNSGGYQLYAELKPISLSKAGETELRFTTVYDNAKDPTDEHLKFQLILDPSAVENLGQLLQQYND